MTVQLFTRRFLFLVMLMGTAVIFCLAASPARSLAQAEESVPASELDARPAAEWIELLYQRIFAERINPPAAARLYAYGGIAAYEPVVPGIPGGRSLSGQLTDMPEMPAIEEGEVYDWLSAATGSLSVVVPGILPENPQTTQPAQLLKTRQINARLRELPEDVVNRSVAYGEAVGQAILDWASTDFAKEAHDMAADYVLPDDVIGGYVLTSEGTKPTEPYWGMVRPFGIPSADACDQQLDFEFSTEEGTTFYAQALEVKTTGDHLTPEQQDIVNFWVDTPGITGTPAGHWMMIAVQMVPHLDLKLDRATESFAMVGISVGDAFISGWSTKYIVMLIRPVTYIQRHIDPNWESYVETPPFPEFISGHSIVSAAAARTLTHLFGTVAFTDTSERFRGLRDRSFTSFQSAANEAAISRLYGGIHYRTAIEKGLDQGVCVSEQIIERIQLREDVE